MKVDMSSEAVTQRIRLTSELRRLAISLAHDRMDWSKYMAFQTRETHDPSNEEVDLQKESKKN